MRKLAYLMLIAVATSATAQESHTVRGYTKADGTYVAPHQATDPNTTKTDNWTTKGNTNPYTGQQGTVDPNRPTQSNPYGSSYNQPRK